MPVRDQVHPKDPVDPSTRPDAPHPVRTSCRAQVATGGTLRIFAEAAGGDCLITVADDPDPPHVRVGEGGTSVTVRVAR